MTTGTVQTMLGYIRRRPLQTTLLSDLFVKERNVHDTVRLVFDTVFGKNEIAPFVSRKSSGHVVGRDGYTSLTHFAPYIKEKCEVTEEDADTREPGTTGFDGISSTDAILARDLDELDMRIATQEERMISDALHNGTVTVQGNDVDYTIDYKRPAGHTIELTGANRWPTILAGGTASTLYTAIDANIRTWVQTMIANSGKSPNMILCDANAGILISTAYASQLDTRRVDYGYIKPEQMDEYNATYLGEIYGVGYRLKVYVYQGFYTVNGSSTNFMSDHTVILANRNSPVTMEYGKISNLKAKSQGFKARRFPNRWMEPDGSAEYITLESAPCPNLKAIRDFLKVHVTAAA